eukprot:TRINITY_DN19492_c0_g2_i1.p1 TRINITY_DN19492_c0_g2~~TRINITY_DN19492_c0_g2_i1.p1  ORF type:complete len:103 (-),score=18.53 TRINITY_DN19492_c0_g2_i1:86-394(-)
MREEIEKINNELLDDIKVKKSFKDRERKYALELEKAKLKEREAELTLRSKVQQDELLLKYRAEVQRKAKEMQQVQKAYAKVLTMAWRQCRPKCSPCKLNATN